MSGVGSSPALATCETSQVLLAGVSVGFPGVLPFRPTYRLARLYERNNLERDVKLNQKKLFALYGIRTQNLYVKFPSLYQLPYGSLDTLHGFHLCIHVYSKLA